MFCKGCYKWPVKVFCWYLHADQYGLTGCSLHHLCCLRLTGAYLTDHSPQHLCLTDGTRKWPTQCDCSFNQLLSTGGYRHWPDWVFGEASCRALGWFPADCEPGWGGASVCTSRGRWSHWWNCLSRVNDQSICMNSSSIQYPDLLGCWLWQWTLQACFLIDSVASHAHIDTYRQTHMYILHLHTHVNTHTHTHSHTHTHTHTHIYIHARTHTCKNRCTKAGTQVKMGRNVALLVECQTGMLLRQVRFPSAASHFLPESTFSAGSLVVSVQPLCAIACINICVHIKGPNHWPPDLCLDTWKYCTHCLECLALFLWLL